MNTDLYLTRDELDPIEVTLFDDDPADRWATIRLRGPEAKVTLYLTQEHLHDISKNIVDAFETRDAEEHLQRALDAESWPSEVERLTCDYCRGAVANIDGRYKHVDWQVGGIDEWYSCSILNPDFGGRGFVATVNGHLGPVGEVTA